MRIRKPARQSSLQGIEFKEGDTLDQRYLVLGVRRGFMGIVYLARDLFGPDEEVVALKTFQRKFTWVPEAIDNFTREAEVWMRLGWHPNIVQARRVLTISGRPHIVMEYIDGQSLRQLAKILSIPQIIDFAIQICWAMQYAYERCAIVHRDLKPDNVLITNQNIAKVTDFGLAQAVPGVLGDEGREVGELLTLRTEARDIFRGSQPYMSPEQRVPDGQLGPWSDIYSVGVMLFELLTGRLPFVAPTVAELNRLHLEAAPPNPRLLEHALPMGTEYIVLQCLEKRPEDRYRSFDRLERDLQGLRQHHFGEKLSLPRDLEVISEAHRADGRGLAYLSLEEYHSARQWLRIAVGHEPCRAQFWIHLAIAEMKLMHFEETLACLRQAEEQKPSYDDRLEIWLLRGESYEKLFQFNEALNAYHQLIVLDRRYRQGWAGMARVFIKLSRFREALNALDEACRLDPNDPLVLVARADLERALGHRKQAIQSYDEALKLNPRDVAAWCGKGSCLLELKRYPEALECYQKACSIDPSSQDAQLGALECRKLLGVE